MVSVKVLRDFVEENLELFKRMEEPVLFWFKDFCSYTLYREDNAYRVKVKCLNEERDELLFIIEDEVIINHASEVLKELRKKHLEEIKRLLS